VAPRDRGLDLHFQPGVRRSHARRCAVVFPSVLIDACPEGADVDLNDIHVPVALGRLSDEVALSGIRQRISCLDQVAPEERRQQILILFDLIGIGVLHPQVL
jgi:hypothetical protein